MTTVQDILALIGTALPLLAGLITFFCKFVKNERAKKALQAAAKLSECLQPLVIQAEQFTHYTGEEKKQYVLTRASRSAAQQGTRFDEERASLLIDQLIATTKKVNARAKDLARAGGTDTQKAI